MEKEVMGRLTDFGFSILEPNRKMCWMQKQAIYLFWTIFATFSKFCSIYDAPHFEKMSKMVQIWEKMEKLSKFGWPIHH